MQKRINICGIPIDVLTMDETIKKIEISIQKKQLIHHVVVNAAKMVNAQKDDQLRDSIVNCDIINADGQAVVWASKILKQPLPERVAGIDLMENLVINAHKNNFKIFLLGAKEEIVKKVYDIYKKKYHSEIIVGYRNGYFKEEEELEVANQIANSGADILFVAITSPKKEIFLNKYKDIIKTSFIMGVGGSFDVVAGFTKRAPKWMQKIGMEWFYRFLQEPKRMWKRYLVSNTKFITLILSEKIKQIFNSK